MQEKLLLKVSLIAALIGILSLFLLSENITVDEISIDKLNELPEGSDVTIKGFVENVKDLDKIMILDIAQLKTVQVVLFKSENITFNEGDFVEIQGEIQEYKGKMEIIGNRVKVS